MTTKQKWIDAKPPFLNQWPIHWTIIQQKTERTLFTAMLWHVIIPTCMCLGSWSYLYPATMCTSKVGLYCRRDSASGMTKILNEYNPSTAVTRKNAGIINNDGNTAFCKVTGGWVNRGVGFGLKVSWVYKLSRQQVHIKNVKTLHTCTFSKHWHWLLYYPAMLYTLSWV